MLGLFKSGSQDADNAAIKRALSPEVVVVVSASCCMQGTADVDARAEAAARTALKTASLNWPVLVVTVTQAQSALGRISGELDATQGALAAQVSELFLTHGLTAFPVLLVNQRLVSYGGAPDEALVLNALPSTVKPTLMQDAHENAA